MHLTPFTETDYPLLIDWIGTEEFNLLWGGPLYQWPINIEQISQHQLKKEVTAFIAVEDHQKIGFIELFKKSDRHYRICRVLIGKPSFLGKGYGKTLVQLAMDYAKEKFGAERISLGVFEQNETAIRLYQTLGFRIRSRDPESRQFKGQYWPLLEMEQTV